MRSALNTYTESRSHDGAHTQLDDALTLSDLDFTYQSVRWLCTDQSVQADVLLACALSQEELVRSAALPARVQKRVQQDTAGNGAAVKRAPAPAFRRRPVDRDEFKQQRAESEAEAERNRKRSGQSASFASLYGTKVGRLWLQDDEGMARL